MKPKFTLREFVNKLLDEIEATPPSTDDAGPVNDKIDRVVGETGEDFARLYARRKMLADELDRFATLPNPDKIIVTSIHDRAIFCDNLIFFYLREAFGLRDDIVGARAGNKVIVNSVPEEQYFYVDKVERFQRLLAEAVGPDPLAN